MFIWIICFKAALQFRFLIVSQQNPSISFQHKALHSIRPWGGQGLQSIHAQLMDFTQLSLNSINVIEKKKILHGLRRLPKVLHWHGHSYRQCLRGAHLQGYLSELFTWHWLLRGSWFNRARSFIIRPVTGYHQESTLPMTWTQAKLLCMWHQS